MLEFYAKILTLKTVKYAYEINIYLIDKKMRSVKNFSSCMKNTGTLSIRLIHNRLEKIEISAYKIANQSSIM